MQTLLGRDIFISICMITYRHEKFIAQAIDSIFMQEVNYPYELVIADDCSPDNTNAIVQNYIVHHASGKTIHYIRNNKNEGVNANFRAALKSCSGKYIALCEGDDFWTDRNKLQQQVDFLEENPQYAIACSNRIVVGNNNEKLYDDFYEKQVYSLQDVVLGFIPGTQTVVLRNYPGLVDFLGKNNTVFSCDRFLTYYCSLFGDIYRFEQFTAAYRDSGQGVWSSHSGIEKMEKNYLFLEDFHKRIGLPQNNSILAEAGITMIVNHFFYYLKRPAAFRFFFLKNYYSVWKKFRKMARLKLLFKAVWNKFKFTRKNVSKPF